MEFYFFIFKRAMSLSLKKEEPVQDRRKNGLCFLVEDKLENTDKKLQGFQAMAIRNKKSIEKNV